VFSIRGLQPFHDFFEGPDWWSEDEIKRVLESISLMKGNFLGFHTVCVLLCVCQCVCLFAGMRVWSGLVCLGEVLPKHGCAVSPCT
jgi:hypothetical protein